MMGNTLSGFAFFWVIVACSGVAAVWRKIARWANRDNEKEPPR